MKAKKSTTGSLANKNRATPPACDCLEISFFGPSYGECVLIHVGNGHWVIVDSCVSTSTGEPQALEYLNEIGADLSLIRAIVATHWDDDHVRGLARCMVNAPNADFVISGAFASEDFTTILRVFDRNPIGVSTGLKEIIDALECMRERGKHPILAVANKPLLPADHATDPSVEIVALSPSDATIIDGHLNIGKLLQNVVKNRIRMPESHRNDRSVVLWLRMGKAFALLGSDLEEVGDEQRGWSAIVLSGSNRQKASAFKIPHHGSKTSHHDAIWTELLETNPPSVITPWKKGFRALPTRQDIERFQKLTDRLYVTTIPQNKRGTRTPEVEQMIRNTALELRQVDLTGGQVRLRADTKTNPTQWSVELFNGARKIEGQMSKAFFDPLSRGNKDRPWLLAGSG